MWVEECKCQEKEGIGDRFLQEYENKLRDNASPEKIFRYFASVIKNGADYMTPTDFARSLTPLTPTTHSKPINMPHLKNETEERDIPNAPEFFLFNEEENRAGLISFGRYIVFITLLAIPEKDLDVAFYMADRSGTGTVSIEEFEEMMQRHILSHGQYGKNYPRGALLRYLFGQDYKKELTFEEFSEFVLKLRASVLRTVFELYNPDESNTISVQDFARNMISHASPVGRSTYLKIIDRMDDEPRFKNTRITFEEFTQFHEVVKQVEQMEKAIITYSNVEGNFTRTNLRRAALACAGVELSEPIIDIVFYLFDRDGDGSLQRSEFVEILRKHGTADLDRPHDLGLMQLFQCCTNCMKKWYRG